MRRYTRGKSRTSHLVLAQRNLHIFIWSPKMGATSYGSTVRYRKGDLWTHHRVIFFQKNPPRGGKGQRHGPKRSTVVRRTLTIFEYSMWRTRGGVSESENRVGSKGYVRLKACWPGREVS